MRDSDYITPQNTELFCNPNESLLQQPVRAIVLEFPGLGGGSCIGGSMDRGDYTILHAPALALHGVLLAYPFPGPWSWMNPGAVRYADLLVDALRAKHGLDENSPLVVTGGSMGGLGALIYTAASRHKVTACCAACPCVDVPKALAVKPDFPRTYLSAAMSIDAPLEEALRQFSPIHRVQELPDIPYHIMQDLDDELFFEPDTDAFVAALRTRAAAVSYHKLPGCKHGEFTPEERCFFEAFLLKHAAGAPPVNPDPAHFTPWSVQPAAQTPQEESQEHS